MQQQLMTLTTALVTHTMNYYQIIGYVEKVFRTPISYQQAHTPHPLALKYQTQFPMFDTETSKHELNYLGHYWGSVSTFMTMTHTGDYTGTLLLWKHGTPRAKLGNSFKNITLFEECGCATLSETGFDGLNERLLQYVGPHKYMQLDTALAPYTTATRYFKEETLFGIVRLGILGR